MAEECRRACAVSCAALLYLRIIEAWWGTWQVQTPWVQMPERRVNHATPVVACVHAAQAAHNTLPTTGMGQAHYAETSGCVRCAALRRGRRTLLLTAEAQGCAALQKVAEGLHETVMGELA